MKYYDKHPRASKFGDLKCWRAQNNVGGIQFQDQTILITKKTKTKTLYHLKS